MHSSDQKVILVTGSAGFIGKELVKTISSHGHNIIALYHQKIPEQRKNVIPVCSDMQNSDLLGASLRGVDTVVHLAWQGGVHGSHPVNDHSFETANHFLLTNLLRAMEVAGTRRLIFLSALGASKHAQSQFVREKYLAESLILKSKIPEKVIVRSSIVYDGLSQEDLFIRSLTRLMKYPGFYPVPHSRDTIAPIFVRDLVKVMENACSSKLDDPVRVIEAFGPEQFSYEDLFKMVSQYRVRSSQIPIKGVVGNFVLPIFEHEFKKEYKDTPRFSDFQKIGLDGKKNRHTSASRHPGHPGALRAGCELHEGSLAQFSSMEEILKGRQQDNASEIQN